MEIKDTINEVDFSYLRREDFVNFLNENVAIIDDLQDLPESYDSVKVNAILILFCQEGKLQLDINANTFVVHKNDLLFCRPNIILNNYMITPDFKGRVLILSEELIQSMMHGSRNNWDMAFYVNKNPVLSISTEEADLMSQYCQMINAKIKREKKSYHYEVVYALISAVLYEIFAILSNSVTLSNDDMMRQGDILFKKFMDLLPEYVTKDRSVSFYSEKLCVTPKYLSVVCKSLTGKTALGWIHDYTTEVIRYKLKHSSHSIKEISESLNFPNLSFFGKYVRLHLGMSPTDYRKQIKQSVNIERM